MSTNLIRYRSCLLIAALSVVSVFGSAGCSEKTEKENWSPGIPTVVFEREKTENIWMIPTTDQAVPGDAKIVFPASPIESMKVTSTCKSDSIRPSMANRAETTLYRTNSVEIRNILPDSIWKRLDFKSLGNVICDISFETRSALGSTWNFTLPKLEIAELDKLANLRIDPTAIPRTTQPEAKYDLICEYFLNAVDAPNGKKLEDIYKTLAQSPIVDEKPQNGGDLSRQRFTRQRCRLAIETREPNTTRQRFLSEIFEQSFTPPKVEITANIQFLDSVWRAVQGRQTVIHVTLRNDSMVHVAYRLHDVVGGNLMIQNVSRMAPNTYAVVENYPLTVGYSFSGQSNHFELGSDRVLEVAPGHTLTIAGTAVAGLECGLDQIWMKNEVQHGLQNPNYQIPLGYLYAFKERRFLSRLLNWDPGVRDISGATEPLNILDSQTADVDGHYPGLTFLRGWLEGGAPREIKISNNGLPEITYCGPAQPRILGGGSMPMVDLVYVPRRR